MPRIGDKVKYYDEFGLIVFIAANQTIFVTYIAILLSLG